MQIPRYQNGFLRFLFQSLSFSGTQSSSSHETCPGNGYLIRLNGDHVDGNGLNNGALSALDGCCAKPPH